MCRQFTVMSNYHKMGKKSSRAKLIKPSWVCRETRDVHMNQLEFLILIIGSGDGRSLTVMRFMNSQRSSTQQANGENVLLEVKAFL